MNMSHPTSFFILDNEELGTCWIGRAKMRLDTNGRSLLPSISRDQLVDKLATKYEEYSYPCLEVERVKKDGSYLFYGLEQWLTKLNCEIKRNPRKLRNVDELLTAGWIEGDPTINSTVHVLHINNTKEVVQNVYRKLLGEWEAKGFRCLNKLRCKTYENKKKDPEFMYKRARKEVLRQMKKTGKMPKQSTIEKYQIKDEEIKEYMGRKGIIYKITSPSGKVYVGQTVRSFEKRMREHKQTYSSCTALKSAIDKYKDQMKYEIIEEDVSQEQLDEREIYWIKELNSLAPNGYNLESGGHYERKYSQEAKDNMRNAVNKVKIEKNGYLGSVEQDGNLFYPRAQNNLNRTFLSNGGFLTKEECIEVLKEYTKDPDNFIKVDSPYKRKDGSVLKRHKKWTVKYKNNYLGDYETEEEGWKAIDKYIEDPGNFVKPERITTGYIFKRVNRWNLEYKGNFLGSYDTKEHAKEALEKYRKDPKNFTNGRRKAIGSIFKSGEKWRFKYKGKHIGYYATKEEAEEARKSLV